MNPDIERSLLAAQLLVFLRREMGSQDAALIDALQHDATTLLEQCKGHPDHLRLSGVAAEAFGDDFSAADLLTQAWRAGDLTVLLRLNQVLMRLQRDAEAAEVAEALTAHDDDPAVQWAKFRDEDLLESVEGSLPRDVDGIPHALRIAAASGLTEAAVNLAEIQMNLGRAEGAATLRSLANSDAQAALFLGRRLWLFESAGSWLTGGQDEPEPESHALLRSAHSRGELLATLMLWLWIDAPHNAEYAETLARYHLDEGRSAAIGALVGGGTARVVAEDARRLLDAGRDLESLRLRQLAARGDVDVIVEVGDLLIQEAQNSGAWAILGTYLEKWPTRLGDDRVGHPRTPLAVTCREPALRDDHSQATQVDTSPFARRLLEVCEQVGWKMQPLGDHLLAGAWTTDAGPAVVMVEMGMDGEAEIANISSACLLGLPLDPEPEWAGPPSNVDDIELHDLSRRFLEGESDAWVFAFHRSYMSMQRRFLEALFRLGEDPSRAENLTFMGRFGITLGALRGRRMTFEDTPPHRYPQAWVSVGLSDYYASPDIINDPASHRLKAPLEVVYCGYTLRDDLSGSHLRGAVVGAVHTLNAMQEYLARLFDEQPTVFNEFIRAVPMLRVEDHRDVFSDFLVPRRVGHGKGLFGFDLRTPDIETLLADPDASAHALNNAASEALTQGRISEALKGFDRAAQMGQPNALSSLIWVYALRGEFENSIRAWETYADLVEPFIAQEQDKVLAQQLRKQIPNYTSNVAIAFLATGDRGRAVSLWQEAATAGHVEARAYPGVLAWRDGDLDAARMIVSELSTRELAAFKSDMEEVVAEGEGWFVDWAQDALAALATAKPAQTEDQSSSSDLMSKAEILGRLWLLYKDNHDDDEVWANFFAFADLGLPMAYLASQGLVDIRPDGVRYIDETWETLCRVLNIEPDHDYQTVEEMFEASPSARRDASR